MVRNNALLKQSQFINFVKPSVSSMKWLPSYAIYMRTAWAQSVSHDAEGTVKKIICMAVCSVNRTTHFLMEHHLYLK